MIISPSKIRPFRLLKGRTFNFETLNKMLGNLIMIPSISEEDVVNVIKSPLFRPTQLRSFYVPRLIKNAGRKPVKIDQSEVYERIKKLTNGRITVGKVSFNSYGSKNLVYDIGREFSVALELFSKVKSSMALYNVMKTKMDELVESQLADPDYPQTFLIFPMDEYIPSLRRLINSNIASEDALNPLIIFLRRLNKGTLDLDLYKKISGIFFYNTKADVILKLDLGDEDFEKMYPAFLQRLMRINSFNNGEDTLEDIDEDDEIVSDEDKAENTKEKIKNLVFEKIAKLIGASKISDFEAASKEEKELIISMDEKIDAYLKNPENLEKGFEQLVKTIEEDSDIKARAIKYIQTKKAATEKSAQMSKNLAKEVAILSSLRDIEIDDGIVEPAKFKVDMEYFDERVEKSSLASIDKVYNEKQSKKDLGNVLSFFSESEFLPMTIDSLKIEDTSDDFDEKETLTVRYKTDEGKVASFVIDIPKIVDERYFYLGGNKKIMNRQLIRLPIIKTKVDRVEITSSFNKMTIERSAGRISRKNAYLEKILKDSYGKPGLKIEYGSNSAVNGKSMYENDFIYEELADIVTSIEGGKYYLLFNREEIQPMVESFNLPENFMTNEKTPLGFERIMDEERAFIYIEDEAIKRIDGETNEISIISPDLFTFITMDILKLSEKSLPKIGRGFTYTTVKFLQTTYPLFVIVGLVNGLTDVLKRYKIKYFISEKKNPTTSNYIEVKFKDKFLYYEDNTKNSLLLSSLYLLHPEEYTFRQFDTEEPYNDFFVDSLGARVGLHTRNTLKINLAVMIDPITRDVLKDLKKPTNIVDLLLEANTMLTNNSYKPQNDLRNYRLRGTESLYVYLYKILANAYVNYQKHRLNGRPLNLEIPKNKLISTFLTENIVGEFSFLNPALEVEGLSWTSAKGPGGVNLGDAFTLEMRAFDESMEGILSANGTPPTGSVGVTRSVVYDPKINHVRGYINTIDNDSLDATNIFSAIELLSPFTATSADPPRQAMQVSQTKHVMPTIKSSKQLIGSGVNKTLPFIISDAFCFKAKESGIIEEINEKEEIAILAYDNGKKDAINLKLSLLKNANNGFFIEQKYAMPYTVGERFEKGDVIAYNPNYFTGKGKNVDYKQGVLAKIAISPGDFSFEDSTLISEKLSEKCVSSVIMEVPVSLGPNAVIHKIVEVGDAVKTNDHLLDFTTSFRDSATSEFLQSLADTEFLEDLSQEAIKSKYTGTVVDMKIFYNKPLEELSPSLQKLIKNYSKKVQNRKNVIGDIKASGGFRIPPVQQVREEKIGKTEFNREGGVIIQFFVKYDSKMKEGDKLTYFTALKGVISNVVSKEESPISEYREEDVIEGILTPTGVISRMTGDIYYALYSNKVLIEVGKQIKEIWEGKR